MWEIEKIVSKGEYDYAVVRDHPCAIRFGYVLLHRIVMENHLNRLLNKSEIIHHINGNKKDNRIENLQVMDKRDHCTYHASSQGREAVDLKCPWCKNIFFRYLNQTHLKNGHSYTACSRSCAGKFARMVQLSGSTHEVEVAISENIVRVYRVWKTHDNPEGTQETRDSVETIRD